MVVYIFSKKVGAAAVGWLVTALFFIYMAMDDGAQIHERVGTAFETIAKREDSGIFASILSVSPSYPWQLIFVPILGSIGLYMSYFLWQESQSSGSRTLIFFALFAMGVAVGLDFIEGLDKAHPVNIYTHLRDYFKVRSDTVWHFAKVAEEFLEMLSITLFWLVFSKHMFYLIKQSGIQIHVKHLDV